MSKLIKRIITVACIFVFVCFVQGCKQKPPPTDTNSIPDSNSGKFNGTTTIEQGVSTVQKDLEKFPMTALDPNEFDPNMVDPNMVDPNLAPEIIYKTMEPGGKTGPELP